MIPPKFYVVLDLETLGLNMLLHQTVEIGAVMIDGSTLAEVGNFQRYIQPMPPVHFEKQALEINKLTIERLYREGEHPYQVWRQFNEWCKFFAPSFNIETVTNNKVFDIARLQLAYANIGLDFPFHYARHWDVKEQARDFISERLQTISLKTMCEAFNIPYENAHGALQDARMTAEVFRHLEALRLKLNNSTSMA